VHPTLGILARFQAFFYASAFSQSDGVPPPDPARVTQTVGLSFPEQLIMNKYKSEENMDTLQIIKETPFELVLEKDLTHKPMGSGWSKLLTYPLLFLAVCFVVFFIISLPAWLYWGVGVVVLGLEALFLYIYFLTEQKATITIDLRSGIARRVAKLVSGKEEKSEIALEQVNRVIIHTESSAL
jgi:hypothetical protein